MQKTHSKNIPLRLFIIAIVVFILLEFSGLVLIELDQLAHSFNLFALIEGVFGPALAMVAAVLAVANRHLSLAIICAIISLFIFATPVLAFMFGFAK